MSRIVSFGRFWFEFVVGDDAFAAAGILAAIGATALLATSSTSSWWLLPLSVVIVLYASLRRAVRALEAAEAQGAVEARLASLSPTDDEQT